jgi:hypothetical protein
MPAAISGTGDPEFIWAAVAELGQPTRDRSPLGPLRPVAGRPLLVRTGTADRRAVLLLDSMMGWYSGSVDRDAVASQLSGHSWRVEVVVKPVGWLGMYRRSAETGLWFNYRHSVHVRGV